MTEPSPPSRLKRFRSSSSRSSSSNKRNPRSSHRESHRSSKLTGRHSWLLQQLIRLIRRLWNKRHSVKCTTHSPNMRLIESGSSLSRTYRQNLMKLSGRSYELNLMNQKSYNNFDNALQRWASPNPHGSSKRMDMMSMEPSKFTSKETRASGMTCSIRIPKVRTCQNYGSYSSQNMYTATILSLATGITPRQISRYAMCQIHKGMNSR